VEDAEHPSARMPRRDAHDRVDDPRAHRRVGLTELPAVPAADVSAEPVRKATFDLRRRKPAPLTDVDLTQRRVGDDVEAFRGRDDLGGLPRASEVARVDRVEWRRDKA